MRNPLFLSLIICLLGVVPATPLKAEEKYEPLPTEYDGSMMPIDFATFTAPYELPDTLHPVYAVYISRHGARYLSGPKKIAALQKALDEAEKSHTLSEHGKAFLSYLKSVRALNASNWGALSPVGEMEQKMMGTRLLRAFPRLMHRNVKVEAVSTYVPRCVMTMYQLLYQFAWENHHVEVATAEGPRYDHLLRGFAENKQVDEYRKSGDWKGVYDDFVARHVSVRPARSLFSKTGLSDVELRNLTMDMYGVLQANRSMGYNAPTTRWMSVDEYRGCWEASNLNHYLRNAITPLSNLAARTAAPLVNEIIEATDHALTFPSQSPVMNAYFGHAETLLPLFSLIRLPGCFAFPHDYDSLSNTWRVQDITPLGANLLMIVSRGPSDTPYVSMQLNGCKISPMVNGPENVAWSTLRSYWLELMESYGADGTR
ncbi:MAG: histidine phosphatase family protein [Muribaculaceae bacterium]|nr:histidine phosphatase family protein [Muribaculaceae bacterium]